MARLAEERAERARRRFARSLAQEHEKPRTVDDTPSRRSAPGERGGRLAGFLFRLETTDGTLVEPPVLRSALPNWSTGNTIPLGAGRKLRVLGVRRAVSSPFTRCVQTLQPLALPIEEDDRLAEDASRDDVLALLESLENAVACTHGNIVELVLGRELKKAEFVVLD